jgi:hypothetical protein
MRGRRPRGWPLMAEGALVVSTRNQGRERDQRETEGPIRRNREGGGVNGSR